MPSEGLKLCALFLRLMFRYLFLVQAAGAGAGTAAAARLQPPVKNDLKSFHIALTCSFDVTRVV